MISLSSFMISLSSINKLISKHKALIWDLFSIQQIGARGNVQS